MSLLQFAGVGRIDVAARAALLATELASRPNLFGLALGAGLADLRWAAEESEKDSDLLVPMLALDSTPFSIKPGLYRFAETRLQPFSTPLAPLISVLTPQPNAALFFMPPPVPQIGSGHAITSPNVGRVGCQAAWNGGTGFLTAGHVAPAVGTKVYNGSALLGSVVAASNPAGSGPSTGGADISVVAIAPSVQYSPSLGTAKAAGPNQHVTALCATSQAAVIMGFCSFLYWPSVSGTYGDTYLTTQSVTQGGDSGSAVVDQAQNVIGMVVGGSAGITTMIQDAQYQLAAAKGIAGLTI